MRWQLSLSIRGISRYKKITRRTGRISVDGRFVANPIPLSRPRASMATAVNSSDDEVLDLNETLQKTLSLPEKVKIPERAVYIASSDDENFVNNYTDTDSLNTLERKKKVEKILTKSGQKPSETDHLHAALAKEASKQVKSQQVR